MFTVCSFSQFFFQLFADHSSSPPRLDYVSMLQYFAADPSPRQGFIRALSMVLGHNVGQHTPLGHLVKVNKWMHKETWLKSTLYFSIINKSVVISVFQLLRLTIQTSDVIFSNTSTWGNNSTSTISLCVVFTVYAQHRRGYRAQPLRTRRRGEGYPVCTEQSGAGRVHSCSPFCRVPQNHQDERR